MSEELIPFTQTFTGTIDEVSRTFKKFSFGVKSIVTLNDYTDVERNYRVLTVEAKPYHPEEIEDIQMYGDDSYVDSDQYEHDSQNEQYDWLKNEY